MNTINLNILLMNIVNENASHCRLCLNEMEQDNSFPFNELPFSLDDNDSEQFNKLSDIVSLLMNDESIANEELPGMNMVCGECAYQIQVIVKFIQQCHNSTAVLHKIVDTVTKNLDIGEGQHTNRNLYLYLEENECIATLSEKIQRKKKPKRSLIRKCRKCDIEYSSLLELRTHFVTVHGVCDNCHTSFSDEAEKDEHLENMQQCSMCDEIKCSEQGFKDHWDKMHSECICNICGKSLQGLEKLKLHELKHKMRQECPKCGKCYTTTEFYSKHVELCLSDQLVRHPMRSRLIKNYKCNECDKAYSTYGSLRVHERFAHGGATGHKCQECGKVFTAPSYLKMHQITHTKQKNFKCEICQNRFVTKEALLYHTRRHTGEKPYQCIHCNERFVNASARAEHIKFRHIGPTFSCHLCPRKFVTKNFLNNHTNRHFDPTSKLYTGRTQVPPNVPDEKNLRIPLNHRIVVQKGKNTEYVT